MLVRHELRKGWRGAAHSHPHEQSIYVVSGAIEISVNGTSHVARTGDSLIVESNATHQATALEDSLILDIFNPRREDYV
jgi:quercetin dioxygenase-like cupin family protein